MFLRELQYFCDTMTILGYLTTILKEKFQIPNFNFSGRNNILVSNSFK
jgi:hypothetical protein